MVTRTPTNRFSGAAERTVSEANEGFTLVELMIALFIFGLTAIGITTGLITSKFNAENNLYETSAFNAALSTLEQMMSAQYTALSDPDQVSGNDVFEIIVGNGARANILLGTQNVLTVPILTDASGTVANTLEVGLTPTIEASTEYDAFWITIDYSWSHPRSGQVYQGTIRNIRSIVASF